MDDQISIITQASQSLFERLPRELLLLIYNHLTFIDVIRLSRVSKGVNDVVDPQIVAVAQKQTFLIKQELASKHNVVYLDRSAARGRQLRVQLDNYACFSCFKIKRGYLFLKKQINGRRHGKNTGDISRICIECGIDKGFYRAGKDLTVAFSEYVVHHNGALRVQAHYEEYSLCRNCRDLSEFDVVDPPVLCGACLISHHGPPLCCGKQLLRGYLRAECQCCNYIQVMKEPARTCAQCRMDVHARDRVFDSDGDADKKAILCNHCNIFWNGEECRDCGEDYIPMLCEDCGNGWRAPSCEKCHVIRRTACCKYCALRYLFQDADLHRDLAEKDVFCDDPEDDVLKCLSLYTDDVPSIEQTYWD